MTQQMRPSLANVYLIDVVASAVAATYALLQRAEPDSIHLFILFAPTFAVGSWFSRYLRNAGVALPYDFGWFYLIGWPIVAPIYAKRVENKRRWRLAALLYLLTVAPTLIAALGGIS